jgi:hypothetical protein
MKNIIIVSAISFLFSINFISAQNINWRSFTEDQKQIANLNVGFDNSFSIGAAYGYKLNTNLFPVLFNFEYSSPFGNKLFDDFKTKFGAQAEVYKINNFSATVKVNGIFRRNQSPLVRLANFGSEFTGIIGYYRTKWYAAAEFGFDKAIATHIKNSAIMKEYYPAVQDGWYVPTGGNFFYGLQLGYSFKSSDISVKIGKTIAQDFKSTAALPVYFQLGFNKRF